MRKYTLKEIEESMRKEFVWSDEVCGVEFVKTPEDGDWFDKFFNDFKKNLPK